MNTRRGFLGAVIKAAVACAMAPLALLKAKHVPGVRVSINPDYKNAPYQEWSLHFHDNYWWSIAKRDDTVGDTAHWRNVDGNLEAIPVKFPRRFVIVGGKYKEVSTFKWEQV